jgi:hypothetical protein
VEPGSFERKLKLASSSVVSASGPFRMVVVGAARSAATVHVQLAAVSSTFPAASVARASRVCGPSARPVKTVGSGHGVKPALSSEHSNVEAASSLSIANVAVARVLGTSGSGPKTIVVSGGSSSVTVHEYDVIGGSGSASGTSTRTSNVYDPNGSPPYVFGDAQTENVPSTVGVVRAHSYWRSRPRASKANVALWLSVLASGFDVMSTGGASMATFQSNSAGVAST